MKQRLHDLVQTPIPTEFGNFILHYYSADDNNKEHIALVKGDVSEQEDVLVRIHSECFTGDVFGSRRCDCGEQLTMAMALIEQKGNGVLIYLRQEGRGIGLLKKLQAYNLQDQGMDTVDANLHLGHLDDEREYSVAALILESLRINSVNLMTNNPRKIDALTKLGVSVTKRIPAEVLAHEQNIVYLKTKAKKMSHFLFEKDNEEK